MNIARIGFYIKTLLRNLLSAKAVAAVLSSLGALYTVLKCVDYFHLAQQSDVQRFWWVFFGLGLLGAVWSCRPKLRVSHKLKDQDVMIEIAIGNLFSFGGAIVLGTNSTFDTEISTKLISEKSIQGQFTRLYYDDYTLLDADVESALAASGVLPERLRGPRKGKDKRYPIGTVVKVAPKGRTGYFLAISHLNEHGVASDASFEDLRKALAELWGFIGDKGAKDRVVTPVLGSGFARLRQPREVIVREIIKSFVAACAEKTFCDTLTIVISASDALSNQVDLGALGDYLRYVCTYTEIAVDTGERIGTPID